MLDWLRGHFSLNPAWATFGTHGEFTVADFGIEWFGNEYYGIRASLLGLGIAFGYWPGGKFDDTDGAGA